jgi:stage II sporulation protein D
LLAEIEDRLRATGHEPGRIVSVAVLSKNASGRVSTLEIKDDTGSSITFSGKDFRQIVGPNNVRSIKFEVYVSGVKLVLKGFGWGHGVGMCQWGSYGLAQRGRTAEEILKFYYPGAEVTTIDKIGPK